MRKGKGNRKGERGRVSPLKRARLKKGRGVLGRRGKKSILKGRNGTPSGGNKTSLTSGNKGEAPHNG